MFNSKCEEIQGRAEEGVKTGEGWSQRERRSGVKDKRKMLNVNRFLQKVQKITAK